MAQVKFVNVAKYNGVHYPAHTPFDVEDRDVPALIKAGAIVTVPPQEQEDDNEIVKSIKSMTVEQLKAYAAEHEIDIKGIERKPDIVTAIIKAVIPDDETSGDE